MRDWYMRWRETDEARWWAFTIVWFVTVLIALVS